MEGGNIGKLNETGSHFKSVTFKINAEVAMVKTTEELFHSIYFKYSEVVIESKSLKYKISK